MRKEMFAALLALGLIGVSCSSDDSSSNNGNGTRPNQHIKYITNVDTFYLEDGVMEQDSKVVMQYSTANRLESMQSTELGSEDEPNNTGNIKFVYGASSKLEKVGEASELKLVSDMLLYKNDAYKMGKVLKYDNRKNPIEILVYNEEKEQDILKVTYDEKPFFAFHTLRAAGIIEAIDGVSLNFAAPSTPPQLKLAKELIPTNNPVALQIIDHTGRVLTDLKITYQYDDKNYPKVAVMHATHQYEAIVAIKDNKPVYGWKTSTEESKVNLTYKE
ncbi:MAG: hypothetical protein LBE34_05930 [Flavobacteriaceae bacterium]|jgi:hypothetical protein|nr:hypothetical protein [Flavobacteriaceae bacterium]